MRQLEKTAREIASDAIRAMLPDEAVIRALKDMTLGSRVTIFAFGKAAWRMADAAVRFLGKSRVRGGIVLTKYGHSLGAIEGLTVLEAAHPVPDENGVCATKRMLALAQSLTDEDDALVLVSGGGSALLESPAEGVTLARMREITDALLRAGADITEINCVRKHLSAVKGGRLALQMGSARVHTVALSDVLGGQRDVIASGPTCPDSSTADEAKAVLARYLIPLTPSEEAALARETPKTLPENDFLVTGSVEALCEAAKASAEAHGFRAKVVSTRRTGEAVDEGRFLGTLARDMSPKTALVFGGETVVHVHGHGKGGRNQELALGAALAMEGLADTCVIAVGSDGTDGPTDAAGACVTGEYVAEVGRERILAHLADNNAYPLLQATSAAVFTGPTGTNVNDLYLLLRG